MFSLLLSFLYIFRRILKKKLPHFVTVSSDFITWCNRCLKKNLLFYFMFNAYIIQIHCNKKKIRRIFCIISELQIVIIYVASRIFLEINIQGSRMVLNTIEKKNENLIQKLSTMDTNLFLLPKVFLFLDL